jgi:hypothetical protein
VAGFTNVPADEDVVREGRHVASHESGLKSHEPGQGSTVSNARIDIDRIASGGSSRQPISRSGKARIDRSGPVVPKSRWVVEPGSHSGYTGSIEGETGRTAREGLP